MMKHTLEYCQKEFTNHSIISYFFESRGSSLEKTTLGMLQTLVSQLLDQNDQLPDVFFEFFRGKLRVQDQSDWRWVRVELEKFLRLAIQQPSTKPLIILIDAIDECEELEVQSASSFLEDLLQLSDEKGVALKLCVSSRCCLLCMHLKQGTVGLALSNRQEHLKDIATYIQDKLLSSSHNIKTKILKDCEGNFLWVVMVVATLNRWHAEDQDESVRAILDDELASINDGLYTLLEPEYGSGDQTSAEKTLLLELVLLSKRPLRLEEVCAAIGRAPAENGISERYITNLSYGLVEVQEHRDGEMFVHFIHNMVNDYLLTEMRFQVPSPELVDHPIQASHGRLWACCLESVQTLIDLSMTEQDMRGLSLRHPFLSYAADCMLYHAEMAWESMMCQQQIKLWLDQQAPWFARLKKFQNIEKDLQLLHLVIAGGFPNLTRVLLVQNADVMTQSEKRDALQAIAFSGGNTDLLKILLDHRAKINDQGGKYGNVLRAALLGGNRKVVSFLLQNGAKIRNPSRKRYSDLATALRMGNLEIIDCLLEYGAGYERSIGEKYVRVLQAAAAVDDDNEEAVSLLVNRGAGVDALGGFFGSALQVALRSKNNRIVQLLIREGADVNASCGFCGNALQAAATSGNAEMAKLLIDRGALINAEGGFHGSALQAAVFHGDLETMDLLLLHGANIEAEGGDYGNALCAASLEADPDIVEFLLERGANPNANVGSYGNPLQAAAARPSDSELDHVKALDITKLLITRGADINAEGGEYGNALCAALAWHRSGLAVYLLKSGARTDLRDSFKRTALHYAVQTSSVEMAQELLDRGASVEVADDAQASPLDIAIQNRNSAMIHLLLSHAKDMPTLSANDWRDCLEWALDSCIEVCASQPRSVKKHDKKLHQSLAEELMPVIPSKSLLPEGKTGNLITSMSRAIVL